MRKQHLFKIVIIAMLLFVLPTTSLAHSGRTDSNGGHRDNQNQSGLGYYHYHCGGHPAHLHPNGVCPYSSGNSNGGGSSARSSKARKSIKVKKSIKVTKPAKVRNLKITSKSYTSANLIWKKVNKAKGYQIYRSPKKNSGYKIVKTIKSRSKTTFKDRNLKANKTYYYKVRAYKAANNKKYKGAFSAKVKVKTKPSLFATPNTITIQNSGTINVTSKANKAVRWEADDEDIVSCQWGEKWKKNRISLYLTGKQDGITYVTITNKRTCEEKRIKVIVKNRASLSDTTLSMEKGGYGTLSLYHAGYDGIKWSSSNAKIASVNGYGESATVEGISSGTTTITATSSSGTVYSCRVTVK